jgi:hypothetical protein
LREASPTKNGGINDYEDDGGGGGDDDKDAESTFRFGLKHREH